MLEVLRGTPDKETYSYTRTQKSLRLSCKQLNHSLPGTTARLHRTVTKPEKSTVPYQSTNSRPEHGEKNADEHDNSVEPKYPSVSVESSQHSRLTFEPKFHVDLPVVGDANDLRHELITEHEKKQGVDSDHLKQQEDAGYDSVNVVFRDQSEEVLQGTRC